MNFERSKYETKKEQQVNQRGGSLGHLSSFAFKLVSSVFIVNIYTVPHLFFIGFHKCYRLKGVHCLYRDFWKFIKITRTEKISFTFLVITCICSMQIRYNWFYSEFHYFGQRVISQQTDPQYKVLKWGANRSTRK